MQGAASLANDKREEKLFVTARVRADMEGEAGVPPREAGGNRLLAVRGTASYYCTHRD